MILQETCSYLYVDIKLLFNIQTQKAFEYVRFKDERMSQIQSHSFNNAITNDNCKILVHIILIMIPLFQRRIINKELSKYIYVSDSSYQHLHFYFAHNLPFVFIDVHYFIM